MALAGPRLKVSVAVVGLAVALVVGYVVGRYQLWPYPLLLKVEKKLRLLVPHQTSPEQLSLATIFIKLQIEKATVPVERYGEGGGLTSFGKTVLLLTHEGKVFAARSQNDIWEMAINVPDNGFRDYRHAAKNGRFKTLNHRVSSLRYNDILYYQGVGRRGLIISYTEFLDADNCFVNTLAELPIDANVQSAEQISAQPEDWQIVYRSRPCLALKKQWRAIEGHVAGGRVVFQEPATVYLSNGDFHWDGIYGPEALAQRVDVDYGKVIAVDLETRSSKTISLGHRNIQGMAFDAKDRLWTVEHGMRGGDELNLIVPGSNYGWPEETLSTLYNGLSMSKGRNYGRHIRYTTPVFAWLPAEAVSSLARINGFHSSWDGDLLAGSLKGQSLFRIRIRDDRVIFTEKIPVGARIRYVHQHSDGRIVLWTDDKQLIFLSPTEQGFVGEFIRQYVDRQGWGKQQVQAFENALDTCLTCHSLTADGILQAPNLAHIYGAAMADSDYQHYSPALREKGGHWSHRALTAFILDPVGFVHGTTMPNPGVDDPQVAQQIVNFLEALRNQVE